MEPDRPELGPREEPDEASVQRRVLVVRMAAWGTVLLLAVIAFNLRAGASAGTDQGANGPQLDGRTSQGQTMWAVTEDGQVREIHMTWTFECSGGGRLEPFGGTFRASTDEFDHDGDRFRVNVHDELPASADGWTAHLRAEIDGKRRGYGMTEGTTSAEMWFTRGGKRGATCRSGSVRWALGQPSGDQVP